MKSKIKKITGSEYKRLKKFLRVVSLELKDNKKDTVSGSLIFTNRSNPGLLRTLTFSSKKIAIIPGLNDFVTTVVKLLNKYFIFKFPLNSLENPVIIIIKKYKISVGIKKKIKNLFTKSLNFFSFKEKINNELIIGITI